MLATGRFQDGHMSQRRMLTIFLLGLPCICALMAGSAAQARALSIPLLVDYDYIQQALRQQAFTGPGGSAQPWNDGTGCNYLKLTHPVVDAINGKLRVTTQGEAHIGTPLGDQCLALLNWQGTVQTYEELRISPTEPVLTVHVVDTQLLDRDGKPEQVSNLLWASIKDYVQPYMETLRIDLATPVAEIKQFLPLLLTHHDAAQINALLSSLAFVSVTPTEQGLSALLNVDIAEIARATSPTQSTTAAALTEEEIAQWERYVESWDSFFTFVVRQAVADSQSPDNHRDLLELLLDTRYTLTETLAQPKKPGFDPVRSIFLETWQRLIPILRRIGLEQANPALNLQYLSFIAAGDALKVLDELGPSAGIEISQDGLRRLARMVAPADQQDPLRYDSEVDPELRKFFGYGEPIPPPEDNNGIDLLNWLFTPAWGAADINPATLKRLNTWTPKRNELKDYLPLVRDLLVHVASTTLSKNAPEPQFHTLFRHLSLATAWQESCWRQYIVRRGKLTPMRSPSGSVGIMQVNPRVWRGFYDVKGLKTDIAYNARAGSEILMHYLRDLAIAKGEHTKTKKIDNLARAAYSAYNAGPRELTRYRDPKSVTREKRVDEDFWEKYQAIKKGNDLGVMGCFGS